MLRIIMISMRGIFFFGQSAAECRVPDKLLVQRLEKAGALKPKRLGDLFWESFTKRHTRDPREGEFGQYEAAP